MHGRYILQNLKTKQLKIGYDKNLKLRVDDIYNAINKKTCLIIIANPNSPTGTLIQKMI